jgi:hypothetical protein
MYGQTRHKASDLLIGDATGQAIENEVTVGKTDRADTVMKDAKIIMEDKSVKYRGIKRFEKTVSRHIDKSRRDERTYRRGSQGRWPGEAHGRERWSTESFKGEQDIVCRPRRHQRVISRNGRRGEGGCEVQRVSGRSARRERELCACAKIYPPSGRNLKGRSTVPEREGCRLCRRQSRKSRR